MTSKGLGDFVIQKLFRNPSSQSEPAACIDQVARCLVAALSLLMLGWSTAAATLPTGFS